MAFAILPHLSEASHPVFGAAIRTHLSLKRDAIRDTLEGWKREARELCAPRRGRAPPSLHTPYSPFVTLDDAVVLAARPPPPEKTAGRGRTTRAAARAEAAEARAEAAEARAAAGTAGGGAAGGGAAGGGAAGEREGSPPPPLAAPRDPGGPAPAEFLRKFELLADTIVEVLQGWPL